jgi:hypothetical protein
MRALSIVILVVSMLLAIASPTRPAHAASCQFVLGFKTLHDLIPDVVGDCLVDEHHNPTNGDGLQETTGPAGGHGTGLLVWRKADNWTAYTDGYHTWINGPFGLQERLNTDRFSWEGTVIPAAPTPARAASIAPASAQQSSGLYRISFHRLGDDFYRDDNSGALFITFACYEYTYGDDAIFDSDRMLILVGGQKCEVSDVITRYISTQIAGDFNGFDDDNVYALDNGQVWQQTSATYDYQYAYRPHVYIFSHRGDWTMRVDDVEDSITVQQLK